MCETRGLVAERQDLVDALSRLVGLEVDGARRRDRKTNAVLLERGIHEPKRIAGKNGLHGRVVDHEVMLRMPCRVMNAQRRSAELERRPILERTDALFGNRFDGAVELGEFRFAISLGGARYQLR